MAAAADPPSISVAMAVRNGERHMQAQLASVLRQTVAPIEFVAVDDASTDATPAILAAFARDAPFPVRIERLRECAGPSGAFMRAAVRCVGDAIAVCDHDDVWFDHRLERCGQELARCPAAALVMHDTRVVDAELGDLGRRWPRLQRTRLAPALGLTGLGLVAPAMAMVFRREAIGTADFASRPPSRYAPGEPMAHDEWLFFVAGVLGPIRLLAEPLLLYRQHDSNVSGGWFDDRRAVSLRPAVADYDHAAAYTGACAAYLRGTVAPDARTAARLAAGARSYDRAARWWSARSALYRAPDRLGRALIVGRLVRSRAYRGRDAGGLGHAALGKDLGVGLLLKR